ncbi:DUF1858 domain-containing protein [Marinitoga sp. 1138]|uniref:DUF1858 domain-containing protein n=1 Tax=Marinitoga sp. 1138 TaxID=1643334 RepID=UPI001585E5E4|nr:DUF1858 domain-containing protein [Marinitoga sp. 1138]NUU98161.1 hypothetical protein [Marinitoga sp. 1138]
MEKYKVIKEKCIACKACVRTAPENFRIEDGKAVVFKQPENDEELIKSRKAMEICPTGAILYEKPEPITGNSNVKETIEKYPQLKEILVKISPKFKTMQNPVMWNTVAKFATFKNAAKMTGVSLCEILHTVNKELGLEKELYKLFPECIRESEEEFNSSEITWKEPEEVIKIPESNIENLGVVIEQLKDLKSGESVVFEGNIDLEPVIKIIEDMEYLYNIKKYNTFKVRVSVYNPSKESTNIEDYEVLDVRMMQQDPFDIIIKKAYSLNPGEGFVLVQTFVPTPLINMLDGMGFDAEIEQVNPYEVKVYFKRRIEDEEENVEDNGKPTVTIQSATPVGYPIIMRLLQSKRLKKVVNIKELKIWEETEKHLGWIVNGKADISFSALITAAKLRDVDVKMPVVFVWDNFSIITRGYKAKSLEDLKGKTIHLPLFEDAPPAKITKYLIQAKGLNIEDFNFSYGNPFGRPKEIMMDFLSGKVDTVLLREPEAGFVMQALEESNIEYSELDYGKIWNEINDGFGLLPNAGMVLKGDLVRNYPEITKVLLEELEAAINWVNENRKEAAKLSFDMMRAPIKNVEKFLERVTFKYVSGKELEEKVYNFYDILIKNDIINATLDEELMEIFRI